MSLILRMINAMFVKTVGLVMIVQRLNLVTVLSWDAMRVSLIPVQPVNPVMMICTNVSLILRWKIVKNTVTMRMLARFVKRDG